MLAWHWLGRAGYRRVLADQHAARERVWAGADGVVLLCEHPPVITLGRSANRANVLAPGGVEVVPIERGGDVTYHGPGQLMIYPIVRLRRGVVDFLERVAAAIVDAAAVLGAPGAAWRREPAGVWVGDAKLAACGIHVARGVSVHGFALDVATPREAWARINPCGLGAPLVSLSALRGAPISVAEVAVEVGPRVVTALAMRD
ncbi:MAG: lipoyl(octanoyl) transferase LipB [Myxococcales bacterium]|nr:lipoyl(octanoyl) transferase LipB [Myxococcales bacterium]